MFSCQGKFYFVTYMGIFQIDGEKKFIPKRRRMLKPEQPEIYQGSAMGQTPRGAAHQHDCWSKPLPLITITERESIFCLSYVT